MESESISIPFVGNYSLREYYLLHSTTVRTYSPTRTVHLTVPRTSSSSYFFLLVRCDDIDNVAIQRPLVVIIVVVVGACRVYASAVVPTD